MKCQVILAHYLHSDLFPISSIRSDAKEATCKCCNIHWNVLSRLCKMLCQLHWPFGSCCSDSWECSMIKMPLLQNSHGAWVHCWFPVMPCEGTGFAKTRLFGAARQLEKAKHLVNVKPSMITWLKISVVSAEWIRKSLWSVYLWYALIKWYETIIILLLREWKTKQNGNRLAQLSLFLMEHRWTLIDCCFN